MRSLLALFQLADGHQEAMSSAILIWRLELLWEGNLVSKLCSSTSTIRTVSTKTTQQKHRGWLPTESVFTIHPTFAPTPVSTSLLSILVQQLMSSMFLLVNLAFLSPRHA